MISVSTAVSPVPTWLTPTTYAGRIFGYSSLGRLVTATNPETGTTAITYKYWPGGNLKTRTDPRTVTTYGYNAVDQVTSKSYSDNSNCSGTPAVSGGYATPCITYTYSKSWLKTVTTTDNSNYSFDLYDTIGRVTDATESTATTGSGSLSFHLSYFPSVGLQSIKYPTSNRVLTTTYDSAGRPNGVSGAIGTATATPYVMSTTYQPHGALDTQMIAGGTWTIKRTDNSRLQAQSIVASTATGTKMNLGYGYSFLGTDSTKNNGNVTQQTITRPAGSWTQTFGYNEPGGSSLGRLTSATDTGGLNDSYGYDAVGNRWVTASGLTLETPQAQSWYINGAQTTNRINTWGYDGSGNVTSVASMNRNFIYDAENRLVSATIGTLASGGKQALYGYDGNGRRVWKIVCPTVTLCNAATSGALVTTYVYDPQGDLAQEVTSGGTQPAAGTQFLVTDALGSTRLVTSGSDTVSRCFDYRPFGEEIAAGVWRPTGGCYGAATVPPASPDVVSEKFTGQKRDAETGLDYFGARYFSGAQGRFVSPDEPFADQGASDPQSWNLYSYARNSPLVMVDPTGNGVDIPDCAEGDDACVQEKGQPKGKDRGITVSGTIDAIGTIFVAVGSGNARTASDLVTNTLQAATDWLRRPRDSGCMAQYMGAGSGAGSLAGGGLGALGFAAGPLGAVTVPGGAGGGGLLGGAMGGLGGLVMCTTGGGPTRGSGDYRDKTKGAQAREQRNLDSIAKEKKIDRRAFGDWVEAEKAALGRGASSEFGYQKLRELADLYVREGGR